MNRIDLNNLDLDLPARSYSHYLVDLGSLYKAISTLMILWKLDKINGHLWNIFEAS